MVVRLKDLNSQPTSTPSGVVRLKDLKTTQPVVDPIPTEYRSLPLSLNRSPIVQAAQNAPPFVAEPEPGVLEKFKDVFTAPFRKSEESVPVLTGQQPLVERETGQDLVDFGKGTARSATLGLAFQDQDPSGAGQVGEAIGSLLPFGLAAKAVSPLVRGISRPFVQNVTRGAIAGGLYGGARETTEELAGLNNQTAGERLQDVGLDVGLGVAADVGLGLLGRGSRAASRASSANLQSGRVRGALEEPVSPPSQRADTLGPPIPWEEYGRVAEEGLDRFAPVQPVVPRTTPSTATPRAAMPTNVTTPELQPPMNKARSMQAAAERRRITQGDSLDPVEGGLTPKELTAARERASTNYKGKPVTVDGQDGVVAGNSFGKVMVDMGDGTRRTVDPGIIKPRPVTKPATEAPRAPETTPAPPSPQEPLEIPASRYKPVRLKELRSQETQPVETVPNERGTITTLRESGKLDPTVQQRLEVSPARTYEPITNQDTVDTAIQRIARGVDSAEDYALGGKGSLNAEQVATGFRLIDEFQRAGQTGRAVTMAERLAERLTQAGQAVQAASIWDRLTPEGALLAAQRIVRRVNDTLPKGKENVTISNKTADDIMNAAAAIQRSGASQQRAADVMEILDRIKAGTAVSNEERQAVMDFVKDAQQYSRTPKPRTPRPASLPKEMTEPRVRDKVRSFLDDQEKAAKDRLKARGIQVSSLPLDVYADYAIIGAAKLAKGAVKFTDWAEQMVKELGEGIRPQLADIYDRSRELLTTNSKRVSSETIGEAERIAEKYISKHDATIRPEDVSLVRDLAQQVSKLSGQEKRLASQDLQALLNSFERAGIGRKLAALQYISLLFNPKTQIRNVVGNEMMYRLERLSRIIATPFDIVASKVAGKPREITFQRGPASWENFFAPTRDYTTGLKEGAKAGARGVNPEGLTTAYDINGQAFRSKLNPATYLEKALGATMKGFDYAAYNRAVQQRLGEMAHLDAINSGVKGRENIQNHINKYLANLDDNIAATAREYGKYVTLQDDTSLSRALLAVKRGLNKPTGSADFGIGNLVIPFAKTPANLLMRAIDYSPAGFLKSIWQTSQILRARNTDLTRADVIQSVTRAVVGTGLGAMGLWLATKGVLRGESASDRDVRELEKQAGLSEYQLNASALKRMMGAMVTGNLSDVDKAAKIQPGDVFYQYEWAQPSSMPLALGANIAQERKQAARDLARTGDTEGLAKQSFDVTTGALNTLLNSSVLSGLQQAFDLPPGEENKVKAIATNIVKQIPSMATPTFINQINQLMDESVRETYTPGFTDQLLNTARGRIPGLAQELPQRVNTLGTPQTRENNVFDVFLSPAQRNVYKPSNEARMVLDLLSQTGEEKVAPRSVTRYISGTDIKTRQPKKVDLTGEQFVKFQTIVGQETAKRLGRMNPNWSTERRVKAVIDILDEAGKVGRDRMKKELGLR